MRIVNVLPCAIIVAMLVAPSKARAETVGFADPYAGQPYHSSLEPLLPSDPLSGCAFNRPPAAFGTFAFDFLFLNRNRPEAQHLVTVDGVDVWNASDFNLSGGAFRFTATLPSHCGVDLQFSYLGAHDFMSTRTFTGGTVEDQFFGAVAPTGEVTFTYKAPLDSFEVNLHARQWERFAPLVGIRFVSLDESSTQTDTSDNSSFSGSAQNALAGIQFGGDWLVARRGRWRLESSLKAGVYYGDIHIAATTLDTNFDRQFSTTSFLGELRVMAVYEFTRHASFRAGYQGLWMEGTALIYDQYDNFLYSTGNGSADLGSVSLQGGFAGFDLTW